MTPTINLVQNQVSVSPQRAEYSKKAMEKYLKYHKRINASLLTLMLVFSSTINASPPLYPQYNNATGISPANQILMEALWLHLISNLSGIPKSYDTSGYWSYLVNYNPDYLAYLKTNDIGECKTIASNNSATIERAMMQQGLDMYDGSIWQIALSLSAKSIPNQSGLYLADIEKYNNFLINGLIGGFQSYHVDPTKFTYNGQAIRNNKSSYFWQFISPSWNLNYDTINDCNMNWPDYHGVTGEEAWVVLIGPIQSLYILNNGAQNKQWADSGSAGDSLQLGQNALMAIKLMQTATGGILRNVKPLVNEEPTTDYNSVSLENNFSLYAGLSMLQKALTARNVSIQKKLAILNSTKQQKESTEKNNLQKLFKNDQDDLNTINFIKTRLIKFFAGQGGVPVYNTTENYFYAGVSGTQPTTDYAVDVQTWGAAVIATQPELLQAVINAYGSDVLFNMFESTIKKSGYYDSQHNLLGVGYTSQTPTDSYYVLSGEWTLGAINAAIVLADYYKDDSTKYHTLITQAKSMLAGVTTQTSSLQGKVGDSTAKLSFLYANQRVLIPFGWWSNKIPSTASTGWSLMINSCFNPLELGGGQHQAICQEIFTN